MSARLWELLGKQTARYCMGESTSVSVETAQELLASLCYTLRIALDGDGLPEKALLTAELPPLVKRGQELLREKVKAARRLWKDACLTTPDPGHVFYRDTLSDIGAFFRQYDVVYFAHRVPPGIDYPLLLPVPEALQGISYAEAYLRQLLTENRLLNRFSRRCVVRLLKSAVPDYRDMPVNLCEQPLVNAIGRALLGKPILPLNIQAEDQRRIAALLNGRSTACVSALLAHAAKAVCAELQQTDTAALACAAGVADGLAPRLERALSANDLSRVFVTILPENISPRGEQYFA